VLDQHPELPDALNLFGALLHHYGMNEEAVAHLRRAIATEPRVAEYHAHLAVALGAPGETTAAIAASEQAITLQPKLPEPHSNPGIWLAAVGRMDEAWQASREAVRLRPAYPEAHNSAGSLLAGQERVDEAIAAYEEAIRQRPDSAAAHDNLANIAVKRGQDAAAFFRARSPALRAVLLLGCEAARCVHGTAPRFQRPLVRLRANVAWRSRRADSGGRSRYPRGSRSAYRG